MILVTNKNYYESFLYGAQAFPGGKEKVKIGTGAGAISLILPFLKQHNALVFEGKEAGKILQRL